ncbi:MAG: DUF1254 domain-containing protein [Rhizomicrobium sp.]|jgi:uncharacterized membrane protein
MSARKLLPWVALTLATAVAVHVATLFALPHAIMHVALARMGDVDTIHHGRRVDEKSRAVVRPSPDLLYSTCPYDLSRGPLHVHAVVPPGTYWSVSAFDALTNNYFVRNDRQVNGVVDLVFVQQGASVPAAVAAKAVVSPTQHGLILFRTLVPDDAHAASLDAARRRATCATLAGG